MSVNSIVMQQCCADLWDSVDAMWIIESQNPRSWNDSHVLCLKVSPSQWVTGAPGPFFCCSLFDWQSFFASLGLSCRQAVYAHKIRADEPTIWICGEVGSPQWALYIFATLSHGLNLCTPLLATVSLSKRVVHPQERYILFSQLLSFRCSSKMGGDDSKKATFRVMPQARLQCQSWEPLLLSPAATLSSEVNDALEGVTFLL